jgi:hypothetical protein
MALGGAAVMLLLNAAATWFMTGLIWFVQVVHYPLFGRVGREGSPDYQSAHQSLTTFVVFPPMLIELATSGAFLWMPPDRIPRWALWLGFALVGIIWLSTLLLQVPQHNRLAVAFDPAAHRRLVLTNWIRTLAWSARALLVAWMVSRQFRGA